LDLTAMIGGNDRRRPDEQIGKSPKAMFASDTGYAECRLITADAADRAPQPADAWVVRAGVD